MNLRTNDCCVDGWTMDPAFQSSHGHCVGVSDSNSPNLAHFPPMAGPNPNECKCQLWGRLHRALPSSNHHLEPINNGEGEKINLAHFYFYLVRISGIRKFAYFYAEFLNFYLIFK